MENMPIACKLLSEGYWFLMDANNSQPVCEAPSYHKQRFHMKLIFVGQESRTGYGSERRAYSTAGGYGMDRSFSGMLYRAGSGDEATHKKKTGITIGSVATKKNNYRYPRNHHSLLILATCPLTQLKARYRISLQIARLQMYGSLKIKLNGNLRDLGM